MSNMQEQDQTQVLAQLRKELRTTRIFCAISSMLTFLLLVGGCVIVVTAYGYVAKAQKYVTEITPTIQKLSKLDVEEFNRTMVNVNNSLQAVDWEQVATSLEALDVDALNAAIENLDTEELTEALKNLNDASDALRAIRDKMTPLTSVFGK